MDIKGQILLLTRQKPKPDRNQGNLWLPTATGQYKDRGFSDLSSLAWSNRSFLSFGVDKSRMKPHERDQKRFEQTLKKDGGFFRFPPDKYQIEAAKSIYDGDNLIVTAPTGTGKTLIAEYAINKVLHDPEKKRIFYTSPLKALCNNQYEHFKNTFGFKNIGIITGDRKINTSAPVVVMTTEVYRKMVSGIREGNVGDLDSVIYDEFHYMNDVDRGGVWEESVIHTPDKVNMQILSATIGNSDQVSEWISYVQRPKPVNIVTVPAEDRHVPLRYFMISEPIGKKIDGVGHLTLSNLIEQKINFHNLFNLEQNGKLSEVQKKELEGFKQGVLGKKAPIEKKYTDLVQDNHVLQYLQQTIAAENLEGAGYDQVIDGFNKRYDRLNSVEKSISGIFRNPARLREVIGSVKIKNSKDFDSLDSGESLVRKIKIVDNTLQKMDNGQKTNLHTSFIDLFNPSKFERAISDELAKSALINREEYLVNRIENNVNHIIQNFDKIDELTENKTIRGYEDLRVLGGEKSLTPDKIETKKMLSDTVNLIEKINPDPATDEYKTLQSLFIKIFNPSNFEKYLAGEMKEIKSRNPEEKLEKINEIKTHFKSLLENPDQIPEKEQETYGLINSVSEFMGKNKIQEVRRFYQDKLKKPSSADKENLNREIENLFGLQENLYKRSIARKPLLEKMQENVKEIRGYPEGYKAFSEIGFSGPDGCKNESYKKVLPLFREIYNLSNKKFEDGENVFNKNQTAIFNSQFRKFAENPRFLEFDNYIQKEKTRLKNLQDSQASLKKINKNFNEIFSDPEQFVELIGETRIEKPEDINRLDPENPLTEQIKETLGIIEGLKTKESGGKYNDLDAEFIKALNQKKFKKFYDLIRKEKSGIESSTVLLEKFNPRENIYRQINVAFNKNNSEMPFYKMLVDYMGASENQPDYSPEKEKQAIEANIAAKEKVLNQKNYDYSALQLVKSRYSSQFKQNIQIENLQKLINTDLETIQNKLEKEKLERAKEILSPTAGIAGKTIAGSIIAKQIKNIDEGIKNDKDRIDQEKAELVKLANNQKKSPYEDSLLLFARLINPSVKYKTEITNSNKFKGVDHSRLESRLVRYLDYKPEKAKRLALVLSSKEPRKLVNIKTKPEIINDIEENIRDIFKDRDSLNAALRGRKFDDFNALDNFDTKDPLVQKVRTTASLINSVSGYPGTENTERVKKFFIDSLNKRQLINDDKTSLEKLFSGETEKSIQKSSSLPAHKVIEYIYQNHENDKEKFFPMIYFIFNKADCNRTLKAFVEGKSKPLASEKEQKVIEKKIEKFFKENPYLLKGNPRLEAQYSDKKKVKTKPTPETKETGEEEIEKNKKQQQPYTNLELYIEAMKKGVGIHHRGMLAPVKQFVEEVFNDKNKPLKVVVSTETIAAGLDFPAKTVVIDSLVQPYEGYSELPASKFHQMSGRAGRRGKDDIGNVIVVNKVNNTAGQAFKLINSAPEPIQSRLRVNYGMVLTYLNNKTLEQGKKMLERSFKVFQSDEKQKEQIKKQKWGIWGEIDEAKTLLMDTKKVLNSPPDNRRRNKLKSLITRLDKHDLTRIEERKTLLQEESQTFSEEETGILTRGRDNYKPQINRQFNILNNIESALNSYGSMRVSPEKEEYYSEENIEERKQLVESIDRSIELLGEAEKLPKLTNEEKVLFKKEINDQLVSIAKESIPGFSGVYRKKGDDPSISDLQIDLSSQITEEEADIFKEELEALGISSGELTYEDNLEVQKTINKATEELYEAKIDTYKGDNRTKTGKIKEYRYKTGDNTGINRKQILERLERNPFTMSFSNPVYFTYQKDLLTKVKQRIINPGYQGEQVFDPTVEDSPKTKTQELKEHFEKCYKVMNRLYEPREVPEEDDPEKAILEVNKEPFFTEENGKIKLTEKGKIAAGMQGINQILATELVYGEEALFRKLSLPDIIAVASALMTDLGEKKDENMKSELPPGQKEPDSMNDALKKVYGRKMEIEAVQKECNLEGGKTAVNFDRCLVNAVYSYVRGESFSYVFRNLIKKKPKGFMEGDFAENILRTIDFLAQAKEAVPREDAEFRVKLQCAINLLDKQPITNMIHAPENREFGEFEFVPSGEFSKLRAGAKVDKKVKDLNNLLDFAKIPQEKALRDSFLACLETTPVPLDKYHNVLRSVFSPEFKEKTSGKIKTIKKVIDLYNTGEIIDFQPEIGKIAKEAGVEKDFVFHTLRDYQEYREKGIIPDEKNIYNEELLDGGAVFEEVAANEFRDNLFEAGKNFLESKGHNIDEQYVNNNFVLLKGVNLCSKKPRKLLGEADLMVFDKKSEKVVAVAECKAGNDISVINKGYRTRKDNIEKLMEFRVDPERTKTTLNGQELKLPEDSFDLDPGVVVITTAESRAEKQKGKIDYHWVSEFDRLDVQLMSQALAYTLIQEAGENKKLTPPSGFVGENGI